MLKMFARTLAALAVLFTPAVHAQVVTKDADPAIWVVRDKDTTIYLFGTFHALKPGLSWFDEAVKVAFDASDEVMLEMVLPDAATLQGIVQRIAYNPNGPTVTELLPQDKRAAYASAMTGVGVPPALFDHFDPWFPAATLSSLSLPKFGFDPALGAEHVITAAATAMGKPIGGFETAAQQLGFFDGLPQALQVKFLVQTIDELPKMGETLDGMLVRWSAGDAKGIGKAINADLASSPEMAKTLLFQRNEHWAGWIAERMKKPGTVFVAVGAGHLAGKNSVQSYLGKRHLSAKRIRY